MATSPIPLPGAPSVTPPTGGVSLISPQFPQLSQDFAGWLQGLLGQGATPFSGSAPLPSTGGSTAPGALAAPITPLLADLQKFITTGAGLNIPGGQTLNELSTTGAPVTTLPAWQAAVNAMQRNIEQGRSNVREQFAGAGTLMGSPFATAITDYENQAVLGQNAILAQSEAAALEAAQGRRLSASNAMFQPLLSAAAQLGQLFQGIDQASVQATLQEFLRTQPEYGPLLNLLYGLSTLSPQAVGASASPGIAGQVAQGAASVLALPLSSGGTVGEALIRQLFGTNAATDTAAATANAVPNIGIPGIPSGVPALDIAGPTAGGVASTAVPAAAGAIAGGVALPTVLGSAVPAAAQVGTVAAGTGALTGTGVVGASLAPSAAASSTGLGTTLIGLATNPITIAGAVAVAGVLLGRHYIGRGRRTADQITRAEQPKVDAALQDAQSVFWERHRSNPNAIGVQDVQAYFNELDQLGAKFITFLKSGNLGPNDQRAIEQAARTIQGRINTMKNMTAQNFAPHLGEFAGWQALPTFGYDPNATRQA